jgi:hypothetical protein
MIKLEKCTEGQLKEALTEKVGYQIVTYYFLEENSNNFLIHRKTSLNSKNKDSWR